nr:uncharacterized protein LOC123758656 isoform X1 [Procambarus clarkii]
MAVNTGTHSSGQHTHTVVSLSDPSLCLRMSAGHSRLSLLVAVVMAVLGKGDGEVLTGEIDVAPDSLQCQQKGPTLTCDAKDGTMIFNLRTDPKTDVKKVFLYNAREVKVWSSVCVDLVVRHAGRVMVIDDVADFGRNYTNCSMNMWLYRSLLASVPPAVHHLHAEYSKLEKVMFEELSGDLTFISCHIDQLLVNQIVKHHTLTFHSSIIHSLVRLHLGDGTRLYLHNTTIDEQHSQALMVSSGVSVHLSGEHGTKTLQNTVLQPGAVVNTSPYQGEVRMVVVDESGWPPTQCNKTQNAQDSSVSTVYICVIVVMVVLLLPGNVYLFVLLAKRKLQTKPPDKRTTTLETVHQNKNLKDEEQHNTTTETQQLNKTNKNENLATTAAAVEMGGISPALPETHLPTASEPLLSQFTHQHHAPSQEKTEHHNYSKCSDTDSNATLLRQVINASYKATVKSVDHVLSSQKKVNTIEYGEEVTETTDILKS